MNDDVYARPQIMAIAPWFGSKRTLAPEIVRVIGPHAAYWEPFCGSLAVLMAKPASVMETVNDLHSDLINLAHVLAERHLAEDLYGRLARCVMDERLIAESADRLRTATIDPDLRDVERASAYMLSAWCGRNGVAGTPGYNHGFCVRYTRNGGHAAKRWQSAVNSIPDWHERLRNVTILHRDALDLLGRIDDDHKTVIYCDPPYLVKGAKYVHDFTDANHSDLATLLGRFKKTRVVVSYYEHELLADLYPTERWIKIPLRATKAMVNQGMRDKGGSVAAPEVLLVNRTIL
jgi:DNA adenine methylase